MLTLLLILMVVLLLLGFPMMVPLAAGTLFMMFTDMTFFGPDQAVSWMVNGAMCAVDCRLPLPFPARYLVRCLAPLRPR